MSDVTRRRHRLHRDRCVSADGHRADLDLPADPAVGELGRNGRHSERNRSHLRCNPKVWIKVPAIGGLRLRDYGTGRAPEHIRAAEAPPKGAAGRQRTRSSGTSAMQLRLQVIFTGFTTSAISTSSVKQMKIPATT